jgi:alkanesulfonate monooxygenase SsuD/methylene tetrahydromethanopterin reductase-like flavin-dependent oxidoreductase (luciferase family)
MKVGLYFDVRVPSGSNRSPANVYGHVLEMCQEAERAGLDSVWLSEHHGFEDGYLPQPLTFAAAVAARTTSVRIGTAVLVAPLHATVELAEQAAVVDLVSDGRLDLGLGAGYRPAEFELYEQDRDSRFRRLRDQVVALREMWVGDLVTPAPVQEPVPIWIGTGGPRGARTAGRLGADLLFLSPELLPEVRVGRQEAGLNPEAARMSGPLFVLASEDPERDAARAAAHIGYQQDSYRRHAGVLGEQNAFDLARAQGRSMSRPGAFWFDTPQSLADRVEHWLGRDAGVVDTVFLWASLGHMSEREVEKNVELIARQVAPLLRGIGSGADDPPT